MIIAAGNDRHFALLCEALDLAGLPEDPRFATNPERVADRDPLHDLLAERVATLSVAETLERLERVGVPAAPVQDVAQVAAHPQTEALGLLHPLEHPQIEDLRLVAPPLSFHRRAARCRAAPRPRSARTPRRYCGRPATRSRRSAGSSRPACRQPIPSRPIGGRPEMPDGPRLYMLQCGTLQTTVSAIKMNKGSDPYEIPVPWFLTPIRRGTSSSTVDALAVAEDPAAHWGKNIVKAFYPAMTADELVIPQLEKLDIDPGSIRWIVQSHLHVDHTGAVAAFEQMPNAQVLCTRREYDYSRSADWSAGRPPTSRPTSVTPVSTGCCWTISTRATT